MSEVNIVTITADLTCGRLLLVCKDTIYIIVHSIIRLIHIKHTKMY